ncbi:Lrp/AsnC family transcriptional regulator [Pseudorhodobacter sp.]|uniref:Lrp/AsnC family transcriptional regulator n=1 Tax=Pseudorhodobacter sp. TaxID=1934400 RepID=UPI002AFEC7A9|nr:Lrp/AsnC family transcriptional regulator [Pseudorhodobacter sp.]
MDELDQKIIALLGADARISVATLARRLNLARSTVQARLERMETNGTIAGYTVKLGAVGRQNRLRASVLLSIETRSQAACLTRLKSIPEVERVFTTSGRFDLLLEVTAASTQILDHVLDDIGSITGVRSSESLIHLSTKIDRAV